MKKLTIFVAHYKRAFKLRHKHKPAHTMNYITYLRVSTTKQGADGLGVEAQRAAVARFAKGASILREYVEVESGSKDSRPQLAAALAECKATGATLLIAKLDRLSRKVAYFYQLRDAGVNFIIADMPNASPETIGVMAVFAQSELEKISARTKAALQAKKERGEKLGTPENLTAAARAKGLQARKEKAAACPEWNRARALASALSAKGETLRSIADQLNAAGFVTRNGKQFHAKTVLRLVAA